MTKGKEPRLSLFPGKPDEFLGALDALKREVPGLMEYAKIVAQLRFAAYRAYIEEGFTPEQALELCKEQTRL